LGWDSSADINDILYEYGKVFFGGEVAEKVAAGLAMLEQNWAGPIEQNENIEKTLAHWRTIGRDCGEQLARNWRYEMYLFRASTVMSSSTKNRLMKCFCGRIPTAHKSL